MTSSSRLRNDVVTLFDVFCEVGAGLEGSGNGRSVMAMVLQKYPDDFNDEGILKSIRQFCFPCGLDQDHSEAVQLFSFVFTDAQSCYTFGFCRHTPKSNTCICILSALPWTGFFYKFLNHLATVMNNASQAELDSILTRAYHTDIPRAGETLSLLSGANKIDLVVPNLNCLPTLRDDKYLLEFFNAVNEKLMLSLFASLLKERRIVITGSKIGQLSSCIFATAGLLYPMHWQNIFIPVLPRDLTDMLMAPMPFLIGVPKKTLTGVNSTELGDIFILDLDVGEWRCRQEDTLPTPAASLLRQLLRAETNDLFQSDAFSRAFLRTQVLLFGGYRLGLQRAEGEAKVTWNKEKFVAEQRSVLQPYLASLIGHDGVQYLERFVEERLAAINLGQPICDDFEREIAIIGAQSSSRTQMVKENASEVFGALKDRVNSMALKEKFTAKLTPKESRRNNKTSSRINQFNRRIESNGTIEQSVVEPMSFDARQWQLNEENNAVESAEEAEGNQSEQENKNVIGDLIDLSDAGSSIVENRLPMVVEKTTTLPEFDPLVLQRSAPSPMLLPLSNTPFSIDNNALGVPEKHRIRPHSASARLPETAPGWETFD